MVLQKHKHLGNTDVNEHVLQKHEHPGNTNVNKHLLQKHTRMGNADANEQVLQTITLGKHRCICTRASKNTNTWETPL